MKGGETRECQRNECLQKTLVNCRIKHSYLSPPLLQAIATAEMEYLKNTSASGITGQNHRERIIVSCVSFK